jgi:predicted NBD/HSP70 family sugar kinase
VGCLETLLSRRSLLDSYAASGASGAHGWGELVDCVSREGLPPWLDGTLVAAGSVIAGALNILGLRRVVVTGLLGDLPPVATERLFQAIRSGGLWARFGEIDCLAAPRRRAAGLVAAGIDLFSSSPVPGPGGRQGG